MRDLGSPARRLRPSRRGVGSEAYFSPSSTRSPIVRLAALCSLVLVSGCSATAPEAPTLPEPVGGGDAAVELATLLERCAAGCGVEVPRGTALDTLLVDEAARRVEARFSRELGHRAWRPPDVARFEGLVAEAVAPSYPGYAVAVVAGHQLVADLVPNAEREVRDASRVFTRAFDGPPLVQRVGAPAAPDGLAGRHLVVWPSHGWYYEPSLDRWEWQRARLFTTVEDLLPFAFVTTHLAPMLERAGAHVILPRERDTQRHMVIVDADAPGSGYAEGGRWADSPTGFAHRPPYGEGVNPFELGTSREAARPSARAIWTPDLPEAGDYAVYVSYTAGRDRTDQARYTVRHAGGEAVFLVNQTVGAGTWVYLGTFAFDAGTAGSVELANGGRGTLSADAVRFGGGMGDVERGGETSGRPRFTEGARYYAQFAGAPPSVVSPGGEPDHDYRDDYQGRAEFVNWLRASPRGGDGFGPTGHADGPGLGVPVDLSLAFHTDAGVTPGDSTIGTLVIYNTLGMDSTGTFPNGASRLANRDLADRLQRQLVGDVRALYDRSWTQRDLWDRPYSEATRGKVPSVLLELLSHQNAADMRFALDPRFQFDASRAIYKAIGRFLAGQRGVPFVVQPLAPTHLAVALDGDAVRVAWRPRRDVLEPSAFPASYVVYQRAGDGGWDDGTPVASPSAMLPAPPPGEILSVRVSAVNTGGESASSETLAVGRGAPGRGDEPPVLVVNGFDRLAPPAFLDEGGLRGFASWRDEGVPDGVDASRVGDQFTFSDGEAWRDDDAPGWGASHADLETTLVAGNTHDAVVAHGRALLAAGRSFASASDEAVESGDVELAAYPVVALALGEEKTTPWPSPRDPRPDQFTALPSPMRAALATYLDDGGRLLVSGAHWATDTAGLRGDSLGVAFLADVLGVRWRTDHAATTGELAATAGGLLPEGTALTYAHQRGPDAASIEAPDGIEPAGPDGRTVLRYAENQISAGVATERVVALGVPFESVRQPEARAALMRAVLAALGR